tara:strand:+ start:81205 stop:81435 length:231 start_codon:yes stop_codon:yes gene_type:complete
MDIKYCIFDGRIVFEKGSLNIIEMKPVIRYLETMDYDCWGSAFNGYVVKGSSVGTCKKVCELFDINMIEVETLDEL